MWIGNCDQKASFLLALLGVAATVVCTSDFFKKVKELLIEPFKAYWSANEGSIDWFNILLAVCLIIAFGAVLVSLIMLIFCLKANIDPNKFYKTGMVRKSFFFFKTISEMPYEDFKAGSNDAENDLCTQVYTNATICTKKFKYYNNAVVCILVAIPAFFLSAVLMLFA